MPDGGPRPLWDKGITEWQPAQSRMAPHRGHVSNSNGLPDSGDTILVPVYSTTCDHLRIQEDRSHHPRKERSPVVWRQLLFSVSYITP